MSTTFNTTGAIASRLGVALHKVEYVIRSKGIKPIGKAGCARVFDDQQVNQIAAALEKIAQKKEELTV